MLIFNIVHSSPIHTVISRCNESIVTLKWHHKPWTVGELLLIIVHDSGCITRYNHTRHNLLNIILDFFVFFWITNFLLSQISRLFFLSLWWRTYNNNNNNNNRFTQAHNSLTVNVLSALWFTTETVIYSSKRCVLISCWAMKKLIQVEVTEYATTPGGAVIQSLSLALETWHTLK